MKAFPTALLALLATPFTDAFVCTPSPAIHNRFHLQNHKSHAIASSCPTRQSTTCQSGNSSDEAVATTSSSATSPTESISARTFTHHIAIKTRNIQNAIDFYSLLGFRLETKFLSANNKLAWLVLQSHDDDDNLHSSIVSRIELMEVPSYMLNEPEGMKRRAMDLMERQELLGLNHLALDVTHNIPKTLNDDEKKRSSCELYQLKEWLDDLNTDSIRRFGKSLRIALEPTKRLIGREVYEMAFVYDADGALVELLNHSGTVEQEMVVDDWKESVRDDGWIRGVFDRVGSEVEVEEYD